MKSKAVARHAYLEAEVVTGLAHQIRAIRMQRGWTQGELAKLLNTTQAAVSRLEDPSYGRYSLTTLMDIAKTFDTGMQVRFVSFVTMLHETFIPNAEAREVPTFEDEALNVSFYKAGALTNSATYISALPTETEPLSAYYDICIPTPDSSLVTINFPM